MSPFVSVRFLQTQSDSRLLTLAARGYERAFEALVHRYRRPLLAHCRRLLASDARAEDALQQGLMQAWLALQQGTEVREARPWLYRIVHNASLNLLRANSDTAVLEEWTAGSVASEPDVERRLAVREALASVAALPELQREALLRTAVEGHSHEQVASALGLTDGAVRGLVYRARATLRSAVTALTPPPVANWIATAARPSTPFAQRVAELAGGGGTAGVAAVVLKGGAAVVTAGAVVAGVAAPVVHLTGHAHSAMSRPSTATPLAGAGTGTGTGAGGAGVPVSGQTGAGTSARFAPRPGGHRSRGDRRSRTGSSAPLTAFVAPERGGDSHGGGPGEGSGSGGSGSGGGSRGPDGGGGGTDGGDHGGGGSITTSTSGGDGGSTSNGSSGDSGSSGSPSGTGSSGGSSGSGGDGGSGGAATVTSGTSGSDGGGSSGGPLTGGDRSGSSDSGSRSPLTTGSDGGASTSGSSSISSSSGGGPH
jgi:RNA polymerase sigma factor (sigma-70 family)